MTGAEVITGSDNDTAIVNLAAKFVELRYFAGLGHEQIAQFTGVTLYEARK